MAIAVGGVWIALSAVLGSPLALVPVGIVAGVLIVASPKARIAFVVFGGLFTLQSSHDLGILKLIYLFGMFLAVGAALLSLRAQKHSDAGDMLIMASLLIFALIGMSLPNSLARGTDIVSWLRDASPYLLIGAAPILGADAGSVIQRRTLVLMFIPAGLLSAASYFLLWAGPNHHLVDLPIGQLAYPSFLFPAALFAFALARALSGRTRSVFWLALAGLIFALPLVTGTRSALVLLVIPVVILMSKRLPTGRPRRFVLLAGVALVVALTAVVVVQASAVNTSVLLGRFSAFDPSTDLSLAGRLSESSAAWDAFLSSPILGVGVGHGFTFTGLTGAQVSLSIDTFVSFPAKFGLVGMVFLAIIASVVWKALRSARDRQPELALVLTSYLAVLACYLVFGNPFEEKGLGLALLFLLALLLSESRRVLIEANDWKSSRQVVLGINE